MQALDAGPVSLGVKFGTLDTDMAGAASPKVLCSELSAVRIPPVLYARDIWLKCESVLL